MFIYYKFVLPKNFQERVFDYVLIFFPVTDVPHVSTKEVDFDTGDQGPLSG